MGIQVAKPGGLPVVLLVGFILAGPTGYLAWRLLRKDPIPRNEMTAGSLLKTLLLAEVDFRENDPDANRISDFWTQDVAGLHSMPAPGVSGTIMLIPSDLARADADRPRALPCSGYYFIAMQTDQEGKPYRQVTDPRPGIKPQRNLSRFGFCAYPSKYGRTGRITWIVNEENQIWATTYNRGKPILTWPSDADLKMYYSRPE